MESCCSLDFLTEFDVIIIGASTAGLAACIHAVSVGATVAIIEKESLQARVERFFEKVNSINYQFSIQNPVQFNQDQNIYRYGGMAQMIDLHSVQVGDRQVTTDRFVIASGKGSIYTLKLEQIGLQHKDGYLPVNNELKTSEHNIWAAGSIVLPDKRSFRNHMDEGFVSGTNAALKEGHLRIR
jgi:pyruvate/2-oxoglutarate dehydrogenase complex dihydrolipoamide dehydrogenase (E3) component